MKSNHHSPLQCAKAPKYALQILAYKPKVKTHLFKLAFCKSCFNLFFFSLFLVDWKSIGTKHLKKGWIEIIYFFITLSYSLMELHFLLWEFSEEHLGFYWNSSLFWVWLKIKLYNIYSYTFTQSRDNVYIHLTICNTSKLFRIIL